MSLMAELGEGPPPSTTRNTSRPMYTSALQQVPSSSQPALALEGPPSLVGIQCDAQCVVQSDVQCDVQSVVQLLPL